MSDQQAPATPDTPAVAGPDQAPGTAQDQPQTSVDYEKRYNDLQPEYTRATQRLSELEREIEWARMVFETEDTDTQRQALQRLGYEIPEEEDPESAEWDEEDPIADLQRQIAEERQWRQNIEEQAVAAAGQEFLNDHVQREFERLGIDKLDKRSQDHIARLIPSAPGIPTPPGSPHDELPDIEALWNYFQEFRNEDQKSWATTKQRAPYVPSGGQPANEVPDTGTGHEARMRRASRALLEDEMQ